MVEMCAWKKAGTSESIGENRHGGGGESPLCSEAWEATAVPSHASATRIRGRRSFRVRLRRRDIELRNHGFGVSTLYVYREGKLSVTLGN